MNSAKVLLSDPMLDPMSLDLSDPGVIYFTSHNGIYEYSMITEDYKCLIKFNKFKDLYGLIKLNDNFLVFVHSFDRNYKPDQDNGVWLLSETRQTKIFPSVSSDVCFVSSIIKINENLFYAIDSSKGNVWWFDLNGGEGLLVGKDKEPFLPYYTGSMIPGMQLYPQYTQNRRAPGIVSGVIVTNNTRSYLVLNNFSNGYSILVRLTSDYKDIDSEPLLFNLHAGMFMYSGAVYNNNTMYLATPFHYGLTPAHQIIKVKILDKIDYEVVSNDPELGIIADMKIHGRTIIVTTFDVNYHSRIVSISL